MCECDVLCETVLCHCQYVTEYTCMYCLFYAIDIVLPFVNVFHCVCESLNVIFCVRVWQCACVSLYVNLVFFVIYVNVMICVCVVVSLPVFLSVCASVCFTVCVCVCVTVNCNCDCEYVCLVTVRVCHCLCVNHKLWCFVLMSVRCELDFLDLLTWCKLRKF